MASAAGDTDKDDPMRSEAFDWLMRIEAAPGDAGVRAALEAWLGESDAHRTAYRSVERMWRVSARLSPEYERRGPQPADSLHRSTPRGVARRRVLAGAAVALAACLAVLFLPALQLRLAADHLTGTAELREVTLEDGSVVSLDADSAIAIHYGASRREVALLAGRAFFQVVPGADRPFVVKADDVTVTVTGTAFDVRSTTDSVSVAVESGSVAVTVGDEQHPAALAPGDRLDVERRSRVTTRSAVPVQDVAAWRQRRLVVDGVSLAEVVEELDRHYGGMIVLRDRSLAGRRITGVFDLRRPVEALGAVVRTQHGSVTSVTPYLLIVSAP